MTYDYSICEETEISDPRAGLDVSENSVLPLLGIEPRFLGCPARVAVTVLTECCVARVQPFYFLKRYIARKVNTECTRTSYKTVPFTNLNKYLHYETIETEMDLNVSAINGTEKLRGVGGGEHCDMR